MAALTTARRRSFPGWRHHGLLVSALLLTTASSAISQTPWPQIAIPEGIKLSEQGGPISVNGMPLQMRGFTSTAAPARVAALFQQSLGQPLMDNTVGVKRVIGRSHGAHYVTVQIEPGVTGTRGVIAVTELTAAMSNAASTRAADQQLLSRLAAGFQIVSRTASEDNRRRVEHVVLTNTHSVGLNAASVKNMLRIEGFVLERETTPGGQSGVDHRPATREATTLFFRKAGSEAVAVISRDDKGMTAVVLNTTRYANLAP